MTESEPYYRDSLARVHHAGFGLHADTCAPGILALLEPIREAGGSVLELGCGTGRLTRHLVEAGHRVVATDASPAMLALARKHAPTAANISRLTLPGDALPEADAIVSVGHVLNYLPDEAAVDRALAAIARALRSGGVLAFDVCDLEWGRTRKGAGPVSVVEDDWALVTRFSAPEPSRFVREMTTFVRVDDGTWRRDDERHDNILIETARVPKLLAGHGIRARIAASFGSEELPAGLVGVIGERPA